MNGNYIITINRQHGSGGWQIAQTVADQLGLPVFDKNYIADEAKKQADHKLIRHADNHSMNTLLYSLTMSSYNYNDTVNDNPGLYISDQLFQLQSDTIIALAEKQSCIIVGRCADKVLSDAGLKCLRVFIHADAEDRAQRLALENHMTLIQAREKLARTDKERSSYYAFFTGQDWDNINNYDLTLNSSDLGLDGCSDFISAVYKKCI